MNTTYKIRYIIKYFDIMEIEYVDIVAEEFLLSYIGQYVSSRLRGVDG